MKVGVIPENPMERLGLALGVIPTPLIENMMAMLLARTVMVGTKLGVFEALADGSLTAPDVADRCAAHPGATIKLLNALVGAG